MNQLFCLNTESSDQKFRQKKASLNSAAGKRYDLVVGFFFLFSNVRVKGLFIACFNSVWKTK